MVEHEMFSPCLEIPLSLTIKAPTIRICDLFAADMDKLTGIKSSFLNPA